MEYTVVLTRQPDTRWRAVVPSLPECEAEAETRAEVLAQIKERLAEVVSHTEVLRIELPIAPVLRHESTDDARRVAVPGTWEGFGLFHDDPSWGELFEDIERQRDQRLVGE